MGNKIAGTVLMATALALGAMGCGASATHARRGAIGGEVRVHGVLGLSDAHVLMAEHCHGRFRVVEEAEGRELAMRSSIAGKPAVAELVVEGDAVHYLCTSERAASAR